MQSGQSSTVRTFLEQRSQLSRLADHFAVFHFFPDRNRHDFAAKTSATKTTTSIKKFVDSL